MSDELIEMKGKVVKLNRRIVDLEIKTTKLEAKIEVSITALHIFRESIKGLAKQIGEINSLQLEKTVL